MTGVSGDTDTLATLLRRVSGQDEDAFARFYDLTRARVYGMVLRVLRDPGYSEETTQEVFLQVWRTAGTFDSAQGSALSWVITLAHRRAVDRVRSEQSGSDRESRYQAAAVDAPFDSVTEEVFSSHLDTAGLPDPDLVVRTAGEMRLSNFLLWQASYAEYYATPTFWPDLYKTVFRTPWRKAERSPEFLHDPSEKGEGQR